MGEKQNEGGRQRERKGIESERQKNILGMTCDLSSVREIVVSVYEGGDDGRDGYYIQNLRRRGRTWRRKWGRRGRGRRRRSKKRGTRRHLGEEEGGKEEKEEEKDQETPGERIMRKKIRRRRGRGRRKLRK